MSILLYGSTEHLNAILVPEKYQILAQVSWACAMLSCTSFFTPRALCS